jgi:putative ABC transport system substrate-binding protein
VPFAARLLAFDPFAAAFLAGMRDLGYVDGETIEIEVRGASGAEARLPELAAELVRLGPDVLLVTGSLEAQAARQATSTIPIVFTGSADPIGSGLVASLSRPEGNVTGLSLIAPELNGKRLELLQAVVPDLVRVAVLAYADSPSRNLSWDESRVAAAQLHLQPQLVEVRDADDFEGAFAAMASGQAQALVLHPAALLTAYRERIIGLARQARLPTMYPDRRHVVEGGLMAYGPDLLDLMRHSATYVDKILRGAKPAHLPVERPTVFDFIINLKTARALGLTIPQAILQQATELIQ